ncbi:MAG: UDP-N-acetylmuramate dehydrogenase [Clostridia bacterium]|nr:UDP-N-acetylmuramate dehydrogenase [Clostridia bacterium]
MEHYEALAEYMKIHGVPFREDVTGADCTTFRTGGRIALFAEPKDADAACRLLSYADKNGVPYYLIGNGSNLLIPDEGLDKLFIKLSGELCSFRMDGDILKCGAGASMAAAAKYSVSCGFMGLEWAAGIPGTVGGAVAMNAGAYGGEIKQVLSSITYYSDGCLKHIEADPDALGYRRSDYSYPDMTVLEAEFKLLPDDGGAKERMEDYSARRRDKQPLNYPSAGSTFKRPEGHFAGALIEGAGLKGTSVGGACVSRKHAGFVVNTGGATTRDILELIDIVRNTVYEKYGVMLEPEVKILH